MSSGQAEELQVGAQVAEVPVVEALGGSKSVGCHQIAWRGSAAHTRCAPKPRHAGAAAHAWANARAAA